MSEVERITALEVKNEETERRLQNIENKLDKLLEMAAIGKGSIWLLLKAATFLAALGAAFDWTWDKID